MRAALSMVATSLVLAASLAAATARAEGPAARLVYARAPGTESCADEATLRRAVAARVGYDPFFPFAKQTVVVRFATSAASATSATSARPLPRGFIAQVSLI